ncbi:MAG: MqnA/MqnD/SBP family protein, partial [Bacteroidota bacterium]
MRLSLGFSPCPNDTFIFDAMIHQKIDTEGLEFEVRLGDVEELNQLAFEGALDITKLSYHAYAYLVDQYALLYSGSALGNKVGPLLIAKQAMGEPAINEAHIAIPGKYTTANFLLGLAYP